MRTHQMKALDAFRTPPPRKAEVSEPAPPRATLEAYAAGALSVPMPERIARRPTDAIGLPMLFLTLIEDDGLPHFGTATDVERALCMDKRLCAACAEPLGYWMAFVTRAPNDKNDRNFSDPPMHRECAEYAVAIALATHKAQRPETPARRFALFITREYKRLQAWRGREATFVFRAAPAIELVARGGE